MTQDRNAGLSPGDSPSPIRTVSGKTPIGRAWNGFVGNPSSVGRAIRVIVSAYVTFVLVGGTIIWLLDPIDYPDPFPAFWYVLQTITTVGYGDVTPTDPVGRAVGAFIMLFAVASLSILTAFITSAFVEARQASRRSQAEAEAAAHRERLERRLADLVDRLERIERQGEKAS